MSDTQETMQTAIVTSVISAVIISLIFFSSGCQKSLDAAREATKQEAIKAGLVEGEYGRWVKPPRNAEAMP